MSFYFLGILNPFGRYFASRLLRHCALCEAQAQRSQRLLTHVFQHRDRRGATPAPGGPSVSVLAWNRSSDGSGRASPWPIWLRNGSPGVACSERKLLFAEIFRSHFGVTRQCETNPGFRWAHRSPLEVSNSRTVKRSSVCCAAASAVFRRFFGTRGGSWALAVLLVEEQGFLWGNPPCS